MRKFSNNKIIFVIDLDSFEHPQTLRDQEGRVIAEGDVRNDVYFIHIYKTVDAVQFRGQGKNKNFIINSKVPCYFLEKELSFNQLELMGGPYQFLENTRLQVDQFKVFDSFNFNQSQLVAKNSVVVLGNLTIEDSIVDSPKIEMQVIHKMQGVRISSKSKKSICQLNFLTNADIENVFIDTNQLVFSSDEKTALQLKKVQASFNEVQFLSGHCQFIDSQLRDKQQTSAQIDRFQSGLSRFRFNEWHQNQIATSLPTQKKYQSMIFRKARLSLVHSSLLISNVFVKEKSAFILASEKSVVAVQTFLSLDKSALDNKPSIKLRDSLLVAHEYDQRCGHLSLNHSVLSVHQSLVSSHFAKFTFENNSSIIVGNKILLQETDWYSDQSIISARHLTAFAQSKVVIEDSTPKIPQERRVALKVDHLSNVALMGFNNVVARIGVFGNQGELQCQNTAIIVDQDVVMTKSSHLESEELLLEANALYFNGRHTSEKSIHIIARDQCVIGENGNIEFKGEWIGQFSEFSQLGEIHIEENLNPNVMKMTAEKARWYRNSYVESDVISLDISDARLSGEMNTTQQFQLITQTAALRGSIQSQESLDLASDYLLTNNGGCLQAQDIRVVGNYLGFLGEIQATRSYSRAGGILLDADLVLANNVMTTALLPMSFGIRIPNLNSTLTDLTSVNNIIRAGLTSLNFIAPPLAPLASMSYFAFKTAKLTPLFANFFENHSLQQFIHQRPHQWLEQLSYLTAIGLSSEQQFSHFHLNQENISNKNTFMMQILPSFLFGEMSDSLIIMNGGFNVLPSSVSTALMVANVGFDVHVNNTVTAWTNLRAGFDVANHQTEVVRNEVVSGTVITRMHTLLAHHLELAPHSHEIVTKRAQWEIKIANNKGNISLRSSHQGNIVTIDRIDNSDLFSVTSNDQGDHLRLNHLNNSGRFSIHSTDQVSILQSGQIDNQGNLALTNVNVVGDQWTNHEGASQQLNNVILQNTICINNGTTSYTGYYVVQTTRYIENGQRSALDTNSETFFSLTSDDAELLGVVRDNKVYVNVKNLKNVTNFLEGIGIYSNYYVRTALELVTQQVLELHGLNRDCDITLTVSGVHFDQDVNFNHNLYIYSKNSVNIDHDLQGNHQLVIDADGNITICSANRNDPLTQQPAIYVQAADGIYLKSEQGSIMGQGVHADGSNIVLQAYGDVHLDARTDSNFYEAIRYQKAEALSQVSHRNRGRVIDHFNQIPLPQTASSLSGNQVVLESEHGDITYNGQIQANNTIQMNAPDGHVTVATETSLSSDNYIEISANSGVDVESNVTIDAGMNGLSKSSKKSDNSNQSEELGSITLSVSDGDVTIDSATLQAKGAVDIEGNNIHLLAETQTTTTVEHHGSFLKNHDILTTITTVNTAQISSEDSTVTLHARNHLISDGAVIQGAKGTTTTGDHGTQFNDVIGNIDIIDRSSTWGGITSHQMTVHQEFNVSPSVSDNTQVVINSAEGNVEATGLVLQTSKAEISGVNVVLNNRVLNHSMTQNDRDIHLTIGGVALLSSNNHEKIFQYTNSTLTDIAHVVNSKSLTEAVSNTENLGVNAYNAAQNIRSGIKADQGIQTLLEQQGIVPGVTLGLEATHESASYQTIGNGEINVEDLTITAQQNVEFNGLPVTVKNHATITAEKFVQNGTTLTSSTHTAHADFTVGADIHGVDHASMDVSRSSSHSETVLNQQFSVGGQLNVDVHDWHMDAANVDAEKVDATVTETLTENTRKNRENSNTTALQLDTFGNIGLNVSSNHEESITQASGIHAREDLNLSAQTINLNGAKIVSDTNLTVSAHTINGQTIQTNSKNNSTGISGDVRAHDSASDVSCVHAINVSEAGNRDQSTQESVIYGASETNIHVEEMNGSVDTQDNDGYSVNRHDVWNYQAEIPVAIDSEHHHLREYLDDSGKVSTPTPRSSEQTKNTPALVYDTNPNDTSAVIAQSYIPTFFNQLRTVWQNDLPFSTKLQLSSHLFVVQGFNNLTGINLDEVSNDITDVARVGLNPHNFWNGVVARVDGNIKGMLNEISDEAGLPPPYSIDSASLQDSSFKLGYDSEGWVAGLFVAGKLKAINDPYLIDQLNTSVITLGDSTLTLFEREVVERDVTNLIPGFHDLNPNEILFSQPTASPYFSDGRLINKLIAQLQWGDITPYDIQPIQVALKDGRLFSMDHRRLIAFSAANIDEIPVKIFSLDDRDCSLKLNNRFFPMNSEGNKIALVTRENRREAMALLKEHEMIQKGMRSF